MFNQRFRGRMHRHQDRLQQRYRRCVHDPCPSYMFPMLYGPFDPIRDTAPGCRIERREAVPA